ncbi:hypothetical protein Ancab_028942 [Ancistrocladus abbreviatus]
MAARREKIPMSHIAKDCPLNQEKEEEYRMNDIRRAMMAAWGESDSKASDEEEQGDKDAKLCLMTHPSHFSDED